MVRGIERREIFRDDRDRSDFVDRLSRLIPECGAACFAWALMPNHVHLVMRTGTSPLSRLMARLGTGYARHFNERHDRVGHLFQNRFRSERVGGVGYLKTVIRYVHRNPLRGGVVADLVELERYPWTGHAALLGRGPCPFLAAEEVLGLFADDVERARLALREWMQGPPRRPGMPGGPDSALDRLLRWVCIQTGADERQVLSGRRTRAAIRSRALTAYLARVQLGVSGTEIGEALNIDSSAARRAVARGREEARRWGMGPPR